MTWLSEVHRAIAEGKLILASTSPRRRDILKRLGLRFELAKPSYDEKVVMNSIRSVSALWWKPYLANKMRIMSLGKVSSVVTDGSLDDQVVLGFDTLVHRSGKIYGKPTDAENALEMLRQLSGKSHTVSTACSARFRGRNFFRIYHSKVYFYQMTDKELKAYLKTEHTLDAAGAYKIQDGGLSLIRKIEGPYHNVVGLPLEFMETLIGLEKNFMVPSSKELSLKPRKKND
jgi:septum formation protein